MSEVGRGNFGKVDKGRINRIDGDVAIKSIISKHIVLFVIKYLVKCHMIV